MTRKKILVVDDERGVVERFGDLLELASAASLLPHVECGAAGPFRGMARCATSGPRWTSAAPGSLRFAPEPGCSRSGARRGCALFPLQDPATPHSRLCRAPASVASTW